MRSIFRRIWAAAKLLSNRLPKWYQLLIGIVLIATIGWKTRYAIEVVLAIIMASVLFLYSSVSLVFQYKPKVFVRPADDLCKEVDGTRHEYCLILRPFGADGTICTAKAEAIRNGKSVRGDTVVVEELVDRTVHNVFGIDTWALVDPQAFILPPGPKWVSSDNDSWRRHVKKLIRRALVVVIVLPPDKEKTSSLTWEIEECIACGLVGRMVFLLPPASVSGAETSIACVRGFSSQFPSVKHLPDNTLAVFPMGYGEMLHWASDDRFHQLAVAQGIKLVATDELYLEALRKIFDKIKLTISAVPFHQRYAYARRSNAS